MSPEMAATAPGGRLVMGVRSVPSSPSFGIVRASIREHAATMAKGLQPVVGVVFWEGNLALIHLGPGETAARFHVFEALHEGVVLLCAARLASKLCQPFAKGCVQSLALLLGQDAGLLNEAFFRKERNVLHTRAVYMNSLNRDLEIYLGA